MYKSIFFYFFLAGLLLPVSVAGSTQSQVELAPFSVTNSSHNALRLQALSTDDYRWIGAKIYQNECNSQTKNLTFWNKNEPFPSLGIGHFIWFPEGVDPPFNQTFPDMLAFVSKRVQAPAWLLERAKKTAPWQTREQFEQVRTGKQLTELRNWLEVTQGEQAQFIVEQFTSRLEQALKTLPAEQQAFYQARLSALMQSKQGRFALIDYVNFKGVGGNPKEQYQSQEWGLLSVLKNMTLSGELHSITNQFLLESFIDSAKQRLTLRTELAPEGRNEHRWLKGWFKRLEGYR